jgi:hypothetical protein
MKPSPQLSSPARSLSGDHAAIPSARGKPPPIPSSRKILAVPRPPKSPPAPAARTHLLACSAQWRRGRESHCIVENRLRSRSCSPLRLNFFPKSILTTLVKIGSGLAEGEAGVMAACITPGPGCGGLRCCRGSLNARCSPHAAPLQTKWLLVVAARSATPPTPAARGLLVSETQRISCRCCAFRMAWAILGHPWSVADFSCRCAFPAIAIGTAIRG